MNRTVHGMRFFGSHFFRFHVFTVLRRPGSRRALMQPVPQLSQQNKTQKRTITMNTNWIRTLTLSAAALAVGSVAYGQSRPAAEVPFSFRINGTELPAGKYSIDKPDTNARM